MLADSRRIPPSSSARTSDAPIPCRTSTGPPGMIARNGTATKSNTAMMTPTTVAPTIGPGGRHGYVIPPPWTRPALTWAERPKVRPSTCPASHHVRVGGTRRDQAQPDHGQYREQHGDEDQPGT